MIDIREHGGVLSGQKKQVQFVPQPFTPVNTGLTGWDSYGRLAIGKTIALVRATMSSQKTIELSSGSVIASTGKNLNNPMMDENDDNIYGVFYDSTYRVRCYDKNFNLVWENPESTFSLNSPCVLTKNHIIVAVEGKFYKISRTTGETVLTVDNPDAASGPQMWGSDDTGSKVLFYTKLGVILILNISDLSLERKIQTDLDSGTNLSLYGVALHKNTLHVFRGEDMNIYDYMFDINGSIFNKSNAITTGSHPIGRIEFSSHYQGYVKTLKKGVAIVSRSSLQLLSFNPNEGGVSKVQLAGKGVSAPMINNLHYFNFNTSTKYVTDYGLLR